MAFYAFTPKVQFFDSNGDPLSSGKVYTYEVGTTTNKASYPTMADAIAATNANANPVVLDSRGEAVICLTGPTKFKIDTSADVNVYTADNFYPMTNGVMYDSNNKVVFTMTATASAVNSIAVKNNSTGVNPEISSVGEADIGIMFRDSNGNELFRTSSVSAAVNFIDITNSATGTGITFTANGDDTNIDVNFQAKGTGVVNVKGTATSAAEVRFFEDTDNGTNYVGLKAPASVATSYTLVLPTTVGTSTQKLTTDGANPATLTWS